MLDDFWFIYIIIKKYNENMLNIMFHKHECINKFFKSPNLKKKLIAKCNWVTPMLEGCKVA